MKTFKLQISQWRSLSSLRYRDFVYGGQVLANSLSGYLLYKVIAHYFGISEASSAFDIAFSVPFFIMSISGFSFLHGAISTMAAKLRHQSVEAEFSFLSSVLNLIVISSFVPCFGAWLNSSWLVS